MVNRKTKNTEKNPRQVKQKQNKLPFLMEEKDIYIQMQTLVLSDKRDILQKIGRCENINTVRMRGSIENVVNSMLLSRNHSIYERT